MNNTDKTIRTRDTAVVFETLYRDLTDAADAAMEEIRRSFGVVLGQEYFACIHIAICHPSKKLSIYISDNLDPAGYAPSFYTLMSYEFGPSEAHAKDARQKIRELKLDRSIYSNDSGIRIPFETRRVEDGFRGEVFVSFNGEHPEYNLYFSVLLSKAVRSAMELNAKHYTYIYTDPIKIVTIKQMPTVYEFDMLAIDEDPQLLFLFCLEEYIVHHGAQLGTVV